MLRRLRWQQEQLLGRMRDQDRDPGLAFGGSSYPLSSALSPAPWAVEIARFVSCEQRAGRFDEVETLEMARAMTVQQERAEVRTLKTTVFLAVIETVILTLGISEKNFILSV